MAPSAPRRSSPKRAGEPAVLLADDFDDGREMYVEYLRFSGFVVHEARTGRDAIAIARKRLPDIILLDLSMPDIDGWEATKILKADPTTRQIPIIALTGHALSQHQTEAKKAGCDAVVTKPCLPEDLVAKIRGILRPSGAFPKS